MIAWSTAATIAEIAGAAGVIASLLYLSVQVKHTTIQAQRAGSHELMTTTNTLLMQIAGDSGTAEIWAKGLVNFETLSPVEKVRFSCLMLNLTFGWDGGFHAYESGQLDKWGLQRITAPMNEVSRTAGFKSWYRVRRDWLTDDIRARLDPLVADETVGSSVYRLLDPSSVAGA